MRDVIWTVIIVWLVFKLFTFFKNNSQKKSIQSPQDNSQNVNSSASKKDVKSAIQKGAETEGEYIDYEEIK